VVSFKVVRGVCNLCCRCVWADLVSKRAALNRPQIGGSLAQEGAKRGEVCSCE
jgi:hypothetical protein